MDDCDAVFLSIDVDVVDPGSAPGTGTPEPGRPRRVEQLLDAVRRIAMSVPIAGMDVVEVAPPYDHAEITAYLANRVVLEALGGIAWRARRALGRDVASRVIPCSIASNASLESATSKVASARESNSLARMVPRDPSEAHRASTPLELFFDLTFVVAVAAAGTAFEQGLRRWGRAAACSLPFPWCSSPSGGRG